MRSLYKLSIIGLFLFFINFNQVTAQEKLSDERNYYSFVYKFGFADGKDTKNLAKNSHTLQIGKSFTLNKFLSLGPTVSYSHFGSSYLSNKNMVNIGGNVSIYPKYIAALIMDDIYQSNKDRLFFNVGLQKTITKSDHTLAFNTDLNMGYFTLGSRLTLSPNLGYQYFISSEKAIEGMGFYTVGLNFQFK
ncbi:hypothetical protein ACR784_20265 [Sphingobacterium multivorum]|uniref:hypothetical protein n=1 Tax=Sphingobacterium multivorum TaxID=28454 RepID=UPI003DA35A5A